MFAFELGSLYYNAWCIDRTVRTLPLWSKALPAAKIVTAAFYTGMTASNVFGGYCLALAVQRNAASQHWGFASFFGIAGLPLLLMRQREVMASVAGTLEQPKADDVIV